MRERIIQALIYPQRLMRDSIELQACRHSGHFDAMDSACERCEFLLECAWLVGNDESADPGAKSTAELLEALELSYHYVDARATEWGHQPRHCACEACRWLRDVAPLVPEAE